MKQFFKISLASMVGFVLGSVVLSFLSIAIMAGIIASLDKSDEEVSVKENSILKISLAQPIVDKPADNPFENFDFNSFENKETLTLKKVLDAISHAKTDDRVKGIFLDVSSVQTGMASLLEVKAALNDFKSSGKFIYAYSEGYTQGGYFIASSADSVFLFPKGDLDFRGLFTELMFFKGALDKLEIEMQVIRGKNNKFKSAVEPFMYDKMSDANRAQIEKFLNAFWSEMLQQISAERGISVSELNDIADNLAIRKAEDALRLGFVDGLKYYDEVEEMLKGKVGIETEKDLEFIALGKYAKVPGKANVDTKDGEKPWDKKDYIAIVYAEGEIVSGTNDKGVMGSETTAKAVRDAAEDSTVKAIVLRVNSPGGSALASEVILREVELAKAKKPVVVSMGNLAASGGYYISCKADKIYASNTTITGSIGVFGLIPNMKGFFNNKLGLTFDDVKTNKHSNLMRVSDKLTDEEYAIIQESVEDIYSTFINHVAEGRGLTPEYVDSIGQGRVWAGIDALAIGLVDQIGGVNSAIEGAAELATISDYKLKYFPKAKDPFESFLEGLELDAKAKAAEYIFGEEAKYIDAIKEVKQARGVQARLPFNIHLAY